MSNIKTWVERSFADGSKQLATAYMQAEIAELRAAVAARATPAQPVSSPSSVGAAIRALPLPEAIWAAIDTPEGVQFHPFEEQAKRFSIDGECAPYYGADQIRALLSEAAAIAEQVQGQQVPEGWTFDMTTGGHMTVQKKGLGGYLASANSSNIASSLLFELASDLLAAAPSIPHDGQKSEGV